MKLTAKLALSQLKVNKRRTIWTLAGIVLSAAIITGVYSLGFATGIDLVDQMIGDSPFRGIYMASITGLAAILSVFIISISIVVVSNAFRVSASERTSQFGILKSVGATKKQITQTVVYEGLFLTTVGLPLGMAFGLLLQLLGVEIITYFMDTAFSEFEMPYTIRFVLSGFSLFLSLVVSFGTVMLSAWLPARKAANIPAIDTIRGAHEIQVKNKKVYASGLIRKIFKYEGTLAAKFLKRSKRNFRATVISISFSLILFISAAAFFGIMNRTTDIFWGVSANVTAEINFWMNSTWVENEDGYWEIDVSYDVATLEELNDVTARLQAFVGEDATVMGIARGHSVWMRESDGAEFNGQNGLMLTAEMEEIVTYRAEINAHPPHHEPDRGLAVQMITVDPVTHRRLSELAGVSGDSNILINHRYFRFEDGRRTTFAPLIFSEQTLTIPDPSGSGGDIEVPLHGELRGDEVPVEFIAALWSDIIILVPELNSVGEYIWYTDALDAGAFISYAMEHINPFIIEGAYGPNANLWTHNLQQNAEIARNMITMVMVLTFGFVGLLVAIALTNVISTISENVRTRGKEFAVLQSVGMTSGGIKRMLQLESIFCSVRALVIGTPLGVLGAFGLHHAMGPSAEFAFELPLVPVGVSIVAVFFITWGAMHLAANKLKDRNIIETIRSGSGM